MHMYLTSCKSVYMSTCIPEQMSHIKKATINTPRFQWPITRPWNFPSFSVASRILPVEPCHSHLQPTALATAPQVSAACSSLKCMTLLGKTDHHSVGGKQPARRLNETLTSLESVHLLIWCQSSIPNIGEVRFFHICISCIHFRA